MYNPIKFLAILYPKSPAILLVEVGTRHSHQIFLTWCLRQWPDSGLVVAHYGRSSYLFNQFDFTIR